jgi:hypothetical protein
MNDLLNKISSYNIFNYLFPGTLFAVLADKLTTYSFIQDDVLIGAFVYYFLGLVISRFGSLVIEPILKKLGIIKFSDYKDYLNACLDDNKIELFSEVNNTYRTLTSMFIILVLLKIYENLEVRIGLLVNYQYFILILLLFLMFLLSYRKQTSYITKRIDNFKNKKPKV